MIRFVDLEPANRPDSAPTFHGSDPDCGGSPLAVARASREDRRLQVAIPTSILGLVVATKPAIGRGDMTSIRRLRPRLGKGVS